MRILKRTFIFLLTSLLLLPAAQADTKTCDSQGLWVQVLGSGGPELEDKRASTGYLLWKDGKARVLVDMGAGSMLRYEQSNAALADLDVILLSHLHVDHANDLPALVKASYFSGRDRDLLLFGPTGNDYMPATTGYVEALFGAGGAFRYLQSYIDGSDRYQLLAKETDASAKAPVRVYDHGDYQLSAVGVHHGPVPALGWRIDIDGHSVVFSGDTSNRDNTLAELARGADLLVAHHAIPEGASGVARNLHMPPSVIGKLAADAGVKQLLLSHRMLRTIGREAQTEAIIRKHYKAALMFADDLQCVRL